MAARSWHDQRPQAIVRQRYLALLNQRNDLRDHLIKSAKHERALMDLEPEVALLRTILVRCLDDFTPRKAADPRALTQIVNMIDKVSVLVERIHKMKQKSSISVETLRRIIEAMGVVVARHVSDISALKAIEAEWGNLTLNARTQQRVLPQQTTTDHSPKPVTDEAPIVPDDDEPESEE